MIEEFVRFASSNLQYSYKLVLAKVLVEKADSDGRVSLDDVENGFREFYQNRLEQDLLADGKAAKVNKINGMSEAELKSHIMSNPYNAFERVGWMYFQDGQLGLKETLWDSLSDLDRQELIKKLDDKLAGYYADRVDVSLLNNLFTRVLINYGSAKASLFSGTHPMFKTLTETIPTALLSSNLFTNEIYKVQGSAGQGNWAAVPWVAIMNKKITESTQSGIYVVYLFSADMQFIYLSLMLGVTEVVKEQGGRAGLKLLEAKAKDIRDAMGIDDEEWQAPVLGDGHLAKQYEAGTITYIRYEKEQIPEDERLLADLESMLELYKQYVALTAEVDAITPFMSRETMLRIHTLVSTEGFQYSYPDLANFYLSLRTKPFVILAGISGTGKSQLPKLFARAISAEYRSIPVRPDWNDGSDLLGYIDLEGKFRPGELTNIIEECRDRSTVPYLVVLDEMNLARVEYYMSDLLSIMETRELCGNSVQTDSLFQNVNFPMWNDQEHYSEISLPDNFYLIGTVNMDETTHPFSKKVLDRANTIEFSEVNLTGYREQTIEAIDPINLANDQLGGQWLQLSHVLEVNKPYVDEVVNKLVEINEVLMSANLHVGYRVRDEVVIYMLHNHQLELLDEDTAFDYQLMQKILPRLQGSSLSLRRILLQLLQICSGMDLPAINDDLLGKLQELEMQGSAKPYPRSAAKLISMLRRFEEDGFTSYWI